LIKTKKDNKINTAVMIFMMILAIAAMSVLQPFYAADPLTGTAEIGFLSGELELLSVPSFKFGTQNISAGTTEYPAESVTGSAQVSDLRGVKRGWELNVSLSEFESSTELGLKTLPGSYIKIENSTISPLNGQTGTPPTAETDIQIPSDNTQTSVITAAEEAGKGAWQIDWANADVKLVVLAGTAYAGMHTANLTWTLQVGP
jgi:hypothetical protein